MRKSIVCMALIAPLMQWHTAVWADDPAPTPQINHLDQQALIAMAQNLHTCSPLNLREKLANVELYTEPSDDVYAYSSKDRIVISHGLLAIFNDNDFLHFVVAHELSHHMLSHLDRSRRMFPGEIFEETVAASLRQYFEFELEADLMAVQMLQRCRINTSRLGDHLEQLIARTREAADLPQLLQFQERRLIKLRAMRTDVITNQADNE